MEQEESEDGLQGKVREISDQEDWRRKLKIATAVFVLSAAVFVGSVALRGSVDIGNLTSADLSTGSSEEQLTKYQRVYVDCPDRYLDLCTEMSKIPTEPVEFQRAEDGKLYLHLPRSDRTLIANIQDGGEDGYLVRIEG